jgi:hydroxyethylthiazole kinase
MSSVVASSEMLEHAAECLIRLRTAKPRVHCLTNSVVQKFTADGLTVLGAHPSMTDSLDEVAEFVAGADALLVNLGTLNEARRAAIMRALDAYAPLGRPWALDPVHCDRSAPRRVFAAELLERQPTVLRGNAAEMALLGALPGSAERAGVRVTTGQHDRIESAGRGVVVENGHAWMADVTGTGCLAGALIAAFLAVADTPAAGAAGALAVYGVAAELAAVQAKGPGSFAVALLDALAAITPADVLAHGRISDAG